MQSVDVSATLSQRSLDTHSLPNSDHKAKQPTKSIASDKKTGPKAPAQINYYYKQSSQLKQNQIGKH